MPLLALRPPRALAAPLVAVVIGVLAGAGCGAPDRPPTLGDILPPNTGRMLDDGGAPSLVVDAAPSVPMCNLGPEGGVCACADQPLIVDAPNLYFVLDRSGSMATANKWTNVQAAIGSLIVSLGPRASFAAAVFPDPNDDSCAPGVEVFPPRTGDVPAGTRGRTETSFLQTLNAIPAAGGTPTAATLSALLPRIRSLPGKTYVIFATDGGPNCNANASCSVDQCTPNIDGDVGCPPGGPPNCCSDPTQGGPLSCLDSEPTIAAVRAIAAANVPVYVIGVPGSAPYANLLDELAQAGGTARSGEPQYYAIDTADQAALGSVLSSIAAQITGTCSLQLDSVPPDPSLVNVFFDEKPVPQAGPDGWTLDGTTVTIEGASCQRILTGGVLDVRIVAGCPTVMY